MSSAWCTIESDPGVFSELLHRFGVRNAEVEEVYALHDQPAASFGLIFLFKYVREVDDRPTLSYEDCPELFFAKQVIQNACATQAILSVLLNAEDIDIGSTLAEFKAITSSFDPETKGMAIGNSDVIRNAHNAFAPQNSFEADAPSRSKRGKEDAYHFVAYVPFNGFVFELDGLKPGPILLGAVADGGSWLAVATPAVEERMTRYSSQETAFALLSICPKRSLLLDEEIASKQSELAVAESEGAAHALLGEIEELTAQRADEEAKLARQAAENQRRHHNYLPFVYTLLKSLSERGKLADMVAAGAVRARQARATREARAKK